MIEQNYYCSGTEFEILNCPCIGKTKRCTAISDHQLDKCIDVKDCVIKNHMVHLSALKAVCLPGSAAEVGAKACFDSFIVNKPD